MCGIVGAVAERDVVPILLEGLRRLEYRGYDSAGLAVIDATAQAQRCRVVGKVGKLVSELKQQPLKGHLGIAHTRWATHGKPTQANAHPHQSHDQVYVVHNGIIENHQTLRQQLQQQGYDFTSETDTEVIAHHIHWLLQSGVDLQQAVSETCKILEGAYALGVFCVAQPNQLVATRHGSPLVIGLGLGEHFIASDVSALLPVTQRFIFLEEGDVAVLFRSTVAIYDRHGKLIERLIHTSELQADAVERGKYRHYMLKEIFEQPTAVSETLSGRISADNRVLDSAFGPNSTAIFDAVEAVQIIACGTSYHAGMVARYWLESLAHVPCQVEVASEFRYRQPLGSSKTLVVTLSQSGETADTLAALTEAKRLGFGASLTICNVPESSLVRASDLALMTRAGPEIGVASTKAFTTQLVALLLLTLVLGRRRGLDQAQEQSTVQQLRQLPQRIEQVLKLNPEIQTLAEQFADKQHSLFLGRGCHYPIALEGALKLKEISYIHAEAYPAGELKHGPLALVDANMPVVAVAPNDELQEKLKSNLQEVHSRGGQLLIFANHKTLMQNLDYVQVVEVGEVEALLSPMVYSIPLQLLAYHVALIKGTDVDQPRNLAKSVTVE